MTVIPFEQILAGLVHIGLSGKGSRLIPLPAIVARGFPASNGFRPHKSHPPLLAIQKNENKITGFYIRSLVLTEWLVNTSFQNNYFIN